MLEELLRRRFTRGEYHKMGEAGILSEDDRVELIEGEIVRMSPIGRHHAFSVTTLTHVFVTGVGDRALVSVQNPVALSEDSEPQPDVTLLRRRPDYREVDVGPEDVLLLVEVADTTLNYDRRVKLPLYARAGIREVWVVDVAGERVAVHRQPGPRGYRQVEEVGRGQRLSPEAFPGLSVAVDEIL
ncbi:MAG: Uma2 family endonuclease [Candidatus Rokubacteria bacterium]|nr:Uma2 family endonuclease [Candidatus Rokubacteria bacterium]